MFVTNVWSLLEKLLDQNVKVPDVKYSLKKPEHSEQTIIEVTVKKDPPALP